jgi:hypothetical protein
MRSTGVLVTHPSAEPYGSDRMTPESVRGLHAAGAEVTAVLGAEGPLRDMIHQGAW